MNAGVKSNFVVLTTNRSGSTWVMSTLNSVAQVTAQGELFLPRARSAELRWDSDFAIPRYIEMKHRGSAFRPFSVFSYLDALYGTTGSVGFKLMYQQLAAYPEILFYLMRHRTHVIHLVRRNHLDVLLSYKVKAKLGRAHLLAGQLTPDDLRVDLDTGDLIKQLESLQKKQTIARMLLKWCGILHLEVAYEDLLRDQTHFRDILVFLSIQSEEFKPQSNLIKIRQGRQGEVIRNYDEVKNMLAKTRFADCLDELAPASN